MCIRDRRWTSPRGRTRAPRRTRAERSPRRPQEARQGGQSCARREPLSPSCQPVLQDRPAQVARA
eukprot:15107828-Alexandrium_andersonii.AAC.1